MKPFLKWAGNKYRLIAHINEILGRFPQAHCLMEPFVGSGAVFLNTRYDEYLLSDSNPDLIELYKILQSEGPEFIDYCRSFFTPENNSSDIFYELRETFNTTKDLQLKAALFVYLNRHCYNGLCRYNSKGEFNVPFGRYKAPYFPQAEMLAFYTKAKRATFQQQDFIQTLSQATSGMVVYCDPPYVPLSETAKFTTYQGDGFEMDQQIQLASLAKSLAERGTIVLISNHATTFTEQLYHTANITRLEVPRFISCQGDKRNKASELLALFSPLSIQLPHLQREETMLI
jgi:DNA adenine methylase